MADVRGSIVEAASDVGALQFQAQRDLFDAAALARAARAALKGSKHCEACDDLQAAATVLDMLIERAEEAARIKYG